ncbi:MAG: hypothetical protein KAY09_00375 [Nitrospira sp.]|nr:hypothetical protein [Nitrospira sp.]
MSHPSCREDTASALPPCSSASDRSAPTVAMVNFRNHSDFIVFIVPPCRIRLDISTVHDTPDLARLTHESSHQNGATVPGEGQLAADTPHG